MMGNRRRARRVGTLAGVVAVLLTSGCGSAAPPHGVSTSPPASGIPDSPPGMASWAPWPQALHDGRHSGSSAVAGPTAGTIRWRRALEGAVTPGPVVGADGTIYVASNGGVLHALDPSTGHDKWTYDSGRRGGGDLSVSPLILPDGTVLWPTAGAELVALSAGGALLSSLPLPAAPTSPASTDGQRVYVGDMFGTVTAVDIGSAHQLMKRWTRSVGDSSYGSVVVGSGNRLYTTSGGALVAIDDDGDHGDIAWRADPGDGITEVSAGLADDGTVLLGTNGVNEWAYRPDGTPKWHVSRVITYSSPSVTGTGLAYVGDHSGAVHVFRIDDGAPVADYRAPGAQIWSSTIVDENYRVYLGTQSGHALGLNPTGAVLFDVDLGAPVDSYPALTGDGTLVIGARNGTVTAIG